MKKGQTFLLFIIILFLLYACNNAENQISSQKIDIIIDVDPSIAVENIKMSELFSDINYIPLETTNKSLIGDVSDIIKYKDRFYILDNRITQSIFCFTETGKFIFKIHSIGRGPGEYSKINAFTIDSDKGQLLLLDASRKQILRFTLDGEFIESHTIGFQSYHFSYIPGGYYAFYNEFTTSNIDLLNNGTYPNLIITDENFKIIKTGMEYSENVNFSAIPASLQCFGKYDPSTLSLIVSLNDTIFHISKDGVSPYLHINFKNNQRVKDMNLLMNTPGIEINAITNYISDNGVCNVFYFVESMQNVYLSYSKSGDDYYVYYDKISKEQKNIVFKRGKQFPIKNDIDGGDFPLPVMSDGNFFYGIVPPSVLIEMKEEILSSEAPKKLNILELMNQIAEEDNPIIAVITPKG